MARPQVAPWILAVGYPSLDWIFRVDRLPEVGQTARILKRSARPTPGGCPANIAVACVRLGLPAGVLMAVGDDAPGKAYISALKGLGVNTQGIVRIRGGRSPFCLLLVDLEGRHLTFYDPGLSEGRKAWPRIPVSWSSSVRLGVVTVGDPIMVWRAAKWFWQRHVPILWSLKGDPQAWPKALLEWLSQNSRILIMNRAESIWLQEILRIGDWVAFFGDSDRILVITEGSAGSRVLSHGEWCSIPAVPPRRLVDDTGAGDAFTAGFIWGWINGFPPEGCARVGAVVASFVLEAWGAQDGLPTINQVRRRYRRFFGESFPFQKIKKVDHEHSSATS